MALNLGEGYFLVGFNLSGFQSQMSQLKASFKQSMDQLASIGSKAKWMSAGIVGGLGYAVKQSADFEYQMARVKAITNASPQEFDRLKESAIKWGLETKFMLSDVTQGMGFFALAGYDANKIIGAMPSTLGLAAAGGLEVGQAADIAAKIMAGMGVETTGLGHAMDVMTKAMTTANTDLTQLGEAMKYVGPVAKASGKGMEETVAAIQVLSNAGIQASLAGTTLRNVLGRLSGGTKEAEKVFKQLGVTTVDAGGKVKPLADIIDELNVAMQGEGEAERYSMMLQAFGQRGVVGMMELLDRGGAELRRFEARLQGSAGTTDRIASQMMDTTAGSFEKLMSAIETVTVAFGDSLSPSVRAIADDLTEMAGQIGNIDSGLMEFAAKGAAAVAVAGAMAFAIGKIAAVLGTVAAAGSVWSLALIPLAPLVAALTVEAGFLAVSWAEAASTGQQFGDVVMKNIGLVTGLTQEMRKLDDQLKRTKETQEALTKAQEAAQKYAGEVKADKGKSTPETQAAAREAQAAADYAVEAAEKEVEQARQNLRDASKRRSDRITEGGAMAGFKGWLSDRFIGNEATLEDQNMLIMRQQLERARMQLEKAKAQQEATRGTAGQEVIATDAETWMKEEDQAFAMQKKAYENEIKAQEVAAKRAVDPELYDLMERRKAAIEAVTKKAEDEVAEKGYAETDVREKTDKIDKEAISSLEALVKARWDAADKLGAEFDRAQEAAKANAGLAGMAQNLGAAYVSASIAASDAKKALDQMKADLGGVKLSDVAGDFVSLHKQLRDVRRSGQSPKIAKDAADKLIERIELRFQGTDFGTEKENLRMQVAQEMGMGQMAVDLEAEKKRMEGQVVKEEPEKVTFAGAAEAWKQIQGSLYDKDQLNLSRERNRVLREQIGKLDKMIDAIKQISGVGGMAE